MRFRRPVTETTVAGVNVVALHGEFDMSNVAPVDVQIEAAVGRGARAMVVDLRDATFVNSTLVNALFRACRLLHRMGGKLAIVATDQHTRKVLELMAVDQAVPVYDAFDEAVVACANPETDRSASCP
jgi:anti-anti-sigma factor